MMSGLKTVCQKTRALIQTLLDIIGRARLVTMYTWVFVLSMVIWISSSLFSNEISKNSIRSEYEEYNEALFEQTVSDISRGLHDLIQLSYTVMSNQNMNDFLKAKNFSERETALEGVYNEFTRLRIIQNSISSINLYNAKGERIANTGVSPSDGMFNLSDSNTAVSFSGPYEIDKVRYFGVLIPIYSVEKSKVQSLNGYCCMLISMSFLEKRLPEAISSGEGWCVLASKDGEILTGKGECPFYLQDENDLLALDEENVPNQLIYRSAFNRTDWTLIFGVSEQSMFRGINSLQRINLSACIATGLLILCLFIGIYASFLRPIRQQIRFMNYFAVNRKSRIQVRSHNEMGMLAENLNAMLDDIDRLNDENLQARRRVLDAEYQKKQSELLAYRNQINPHFLYNTFECIRGMALFYDVPDIAAISESLSSFFTYNVRGKGYAPIREIQTHVQDYASIIGYRFMNRFQIQCHVEPDVQDCIFPKMVIQPLVENAIFHGLETTEGNGAVVVTIRKEDRRLILVVADNGCGMDEETLEQLKERLKEYDRTNLLPIEKHGIGMVNLYRRLRMFYGQAFTFSIESQKGCGTSIRICVPAEANISEDEYVPGFFN